MSDDVTAGEATDNVEAGEKAEEKPAEQKLLSQEEVNQLIADRIERERKKFADYKDLKAKASKLDELEEARKSELEKLNDRLAEAQMELQSLKVEKVRSQAAREAGLDAELAEYITAVEPEEALAQAKKLAERLKPKPADLKQGVRQTAKPAPSMDDWLRGVTGR